MKSFIINKSIPEKSILNNQVDLWFIPLIADPDDFRTYLSDDEKHRAQRLVFSHHQRRFIIARAAMRLILARYLSINAKTIAFLYQKKGKPYLAQQPSIEFNLSHSKDTALLAISNYPLGVDIEYYSARPFTGLAKNLFSPLELEYFLNCPKQNQTAIFFKIWAQKEAIMKACGIGLTYPTQKIDVNLSSPNPVKLYEPVQQKNWQLFNFMPTMACHAAICYSNNIKNIHYILLNNALELCQTKI